MRFILICVLFNLAACFALFAQRDSLRSRTADSLTLARTQSSQTASPDSVALAKEKRQEYVEDSLALVYLKPDSSRLGKFIPALDDDSLLNFGHAFHYRRQQAKPLKAGLPRNLRDPWVIGAVISLLIFTALLNFFLNNDVKTVVRSFYNKNAVSQFDKEGGLINSWAFVGLFLLFCLTSGLVLCEVTTYYRIDYGMESVRLFLTFSGIVGILFICKFILLKFVGFLFDIGRQVSEYISVLNLTYFNMAFVLLFVAVCFCLLANRFIPLLLFFTAGAIAIIFAWQYLRKSVNIISDFRFHKFYLFIYLCALEICPVLILIKALSI